MPRLQAMIADQVYARLVEIANEMGLKPNAALSVIIMQHGKASPVAGRAAAPQQSATKPFDPAKPGDPALWPYGSDNWKERKRYLLRKEGVPEDEIQHRLDNYRHYWASPEEAAAIRAARAANPPIPLKENVERLVAKWKEMDSPWREMNAPWKEMNASWRGAGAPQQDGDLGDGVLAVIDDDEAESNS